jgi:D-hydroxyproline dehydrogenase subunit beta
MIYDVAIVGAGILGLAHAYHAARAGKRVLVAERGVVAHGASVRNFGMIWPIGQPAGERHALAMQSREHWLSVLNAANLWHDPCGSLHLAYATDEADVIQEFLAQSQGDFPDAAWWDAGKVTEIAPAVRPDGLHGALWSPTEICVDPREVIAKLPAFLAEKYGVTFQFGTTVLGFTEGNLRMSKGEIAVGKMIVCAGDDIQTLYPEVLQSAGMFPCKLQMMRTAPIHPEINWRMGPMLAAGLTLRHYSSFADCPSLPKLTERFDTEMPEYGKYGIHVLVSQNGQGELTLGDSHEYGAQIEPFNKEEIDDLVLKYLAGFFQTPTSLPNMPSMTIASRWNGTYLKHPTEAYFVARPEPNVTLVTGVGGAGMTLSFGLAERVWRGEL